MKLNGDSGEMLSITWPEFADIHPCCTVDQALGYKQMSIDLSDKLFADHRYGRDLDCQPNSGAQGARSCRALNVDRAGNRCHGRKGP